MKKDTGNSQHGVSLATKAIVALSLLLLAANLLLGKVLSHQSMEAMLLYLGRWCPWVGGACGAGKPGWGGPSI